MLLVVIGLGLGVAGAAGMETYIASQIFGVRAMEPSVISVVIAGLAAVALLACALPARRATRVDPVSVLNA